MPIGGGTFTVQNKILPGAYINFVSMGTNAKMGSRGVAALPLELNWGPDDKVFTMTATDFNATSLKVFGYDPTDANILLVREALKRAKSLLIYRVNGGGTKASATVGGMTVTAKYGGTHGNDIMVAVITNVDDATKVDVVTYLDGVVMDSQTVAKSGGAASLVANDFVTFGTAATLTAATATALTGGTNATVNAAKHTAALNAFEVESFNVIGYPGTNTDVKALYGAFVKRLRDDEGRKIVGVLYDYDGDNMGLINVKNGVILANGTTLTGDKAVAWVTGASAGAEVNESLTNTAYDDAVDVDIKYTKSQFEAAIKAGEFTFYADNGKARVLTDINSLVTIGQNMNSRNDYRHFIIIRVARFIHRQRYVKYICILCIEIMAVIELPIMGRFVNCCCNKYRCVFRQILRMYDCDMIITAINIISIFRRAEHIDCGCILLEHLDLVADICRNAF